MTLKLYAIPLDPATHYIIIVHGVLLFHIFQEVAEVVRRYFTFIITAMYAMLFHLKHIPWTAVQVAISFIYEN